MALTPSNLFLVVAVLAGVATLIILGVSIGNQEITSTTGTTASTSFTATSTRQQKETDRPRAVVFGTTCIDVELARTTEEQTQGLSGRPSLQDSSGLLFVYQSPERRSFWMKDMNFSIDIIWLDERRQVVDVHHDLAPESYPERFSPGEPAQYVLEVPAGTAARFGISVGTTAVFEDRSCE